jgi:hypothetical protein
MEGMAPTAGVSNQHAARLAAATAAFGHPASLPAAAGGGGGGGGPPDKQQQLRISGADPGKKTNFSDDQLQAAAAAASANLTVQQQRLLADLLRLRQLVNKAAAKFDQQRLTAFLDAASAGEVEVVQDMLRQGMSPNTADYDGRTALMVAAYRGHKVLCMLLGCWCYCSYAVGVCCTACNMIWQLLHGMLLLQPIHSAFTSTW